MDRCAHPYSLFFGSCRTPGRGSSAMTSDKYEELEMLTQAR
jgi:hypothetical protein